MALELSELKFVVDDSDLKRASDTIGNLVTNVGKLDKAAKDAAQTEATLARAAKDSAKSNLDNAKAQDVRLKSTITADKADQRAAAAIEKKTKATERASTAIKKNADMLQLQNDTYDFILEGFSKGDAKVLAMAKATGQLSDQLKQVLTDIRQFSKNTFDQTETGLDRMVKSAKEASSAQGFLNNGLNLTSKQAKELSNDLDRLNIRLQHQGKSYQEITKEQAIYKQRFIEEANAVNRATSALAAVEKQRKDVVSATNYLTQADQRMAAALNTSNAALDKAGTDSLVKYEMALRKSGMAQDVVTKKLSTYKVQLAQVQEQEMKRREQHLTRAISPQLMDIGVSLYSGQNPMTVLIQQSGQLVDLFQLSGVEASKLGEAMRKSFYSMVPAIATVTKGLSSLFFGMFLDAGKNISSFIGNVTGMTKALQNADDILYLIGGRITWLSKVFAVAGIAMNAAFGTGVFVILAGLVSLAVGLKQVITENNELAKAFALSGASIGLSHTQVTGYVKTLADSGATTRQATDALLAMAKAGNFTSNEILLVSQSAIEMQKGFGIAIEDTVKQFTKLKEKPVEALLEIAKSSGMVAPEVIKMVQELERAGRSTEAASVAMRAYADVTKEQVAQMKTNYNGFALFMIDLGQKIKQFFSDTFKTLFLATDPNQQLEDQLVKLRDRIKEVSGNLKSLGSFGDPKLLNQLKEQERMLISQIGANVRIRGEEEKRKYINAENAKYEEAILKLRKGAEDSIEKETRKTETLADFRKNFIDDKLKDAAKEKAVDVEKLRLNTDLMKLLQQQADIEYKRLHKKEGKQGIKDLETEIDLRNKQLGLLGSFNNELAAIERRRKATGDEDQYQKSLNDLIKKQPIYLERQKEINASHDLANKLTGKADMLGKDYYKTLEQIQEFQDSGLYSPEKAEALRQAAFDQTELAKEQLKYITASTETSQKYAAEVQKSLGDNALQNQMLDRRVELLGLTSEQARLLSREQERKNKLLKVELEYQTKILKIKNDKKLDPWGKEQALLDAARVRAEEEKTINREVAVQYAEDLDKEIRAIKSGITDSIVTALFEGGKAGSKKLRDVLVNVLRQKVTMVVDVGVNALLNGVIGGVLGGSSGAGGIATGLLGNAAMSAGTSAIGSALGVGNLGSLWSGFTGSTISAGMVGPSVAAPSLMSGLGNMASAIPGWGWAIAGIAALASIFSKKATPHMGAGSEFSSTSGLRALSGEWNETAQRGVGIGWQQDEKTQSLTNTIAQTIVTLLDSTAKTFGKEAGFSAATAFADDTSKDGAWGGLVIKQLDEVLVDWKEGQTSKWAPKVFSDGEAGVKEYQNAVASSVLSVLKEMDLPAWAKQFTDALPDEGTLEDLQKVFTTIANYPNELLAKFGTTRDELVNTFTEAVKSGKGAQAGNFVAQQFMAGVEESMLGNTAGAIFDIVNQSIITPVIDALINGATISEALSAASTEAAMKRIKEISDAYSELANSSEWREFQTNLSQMIAKPLNEVGASIRYVPQFATQAVEAVSDLNSEMENLAKQSEEITKSLQARALELQIERLRLLGDEEAALALERARATEGYNANQVAMWDANKAAEKFNSTLKAQQDTMKKLEGMVPGIMSKYLSPEAFKKFQYTELAKKLYDNGVKNFASMDQIVAALMGSTKDQIVDFVTNLLNTVELTTQQSEALYEVVDALGTLKNEAENAAKAITDAFKGVGDDLVAYIRELATGRAGLATPTELLAKTRQNYQSDYSAAMGGDLEAAQRLADSAKQYIEAQKTVSASSQTTNDVIRMVMQQLSSLGFVKDILNSSGAMTIPQFANGGAFTNSIVSQPTLFNMGQMGESGPEAIMPLSRTSSGSLGVTAVSGKTDELLRTLIEEIRALREQQSGETSAQVNATLVAAERVAEEVSETVSENIWKASTKPALV